MKVEENKIRLRDFTLDDVENKVKWINDPANHQFLHYNIPLNENDTRAWFKNKDNRSRIDCVIEYDNCPVGIIGLLQIDYINKKAEYYITIGDNGYKRKGIATKASELLINYAFDTLGLNKIYLNVDEKNIHACHLYEKLGFICEGIFVRDMLFKNEWINRKRYAIFKQN